MTPFRFKLTQGDPLASQPQACAHRAEYLTIADALWVPHSQTINEDRAAPGIEPRTSRTLSENHATRPSSHSLTLISTCTVLCRHDIEIRQIGITTPGCWASAGPVTGIGVFIKQTEHTSANAIYKNHFLLLYSMPEKDLWILFGGHPLKLERYRED